MKSQLVLQFGMFKVLSDEGRLLYRGASRDITPKAFQVLVILLGNQGHVVTDDELIARLWGETVDDKNRLAVTKKLAVTVSALRKALGDARDSDCGEIERPQRYSSLRKASVGARGETKYRYVERVSGKGYRFKPPVRVCEEDEAERLMEIEKKRVTTRVVYEAEQISLTDRGSAVLCGEKEEALEPAASRGKSPFGPVGPPQLPDARFRHRGRRAAVRISPTMGIATLLAIVLVWVLWPVRTPKVLGFAKVTHDGRWKGYTSPLLTDGALAYFQEYRGAGLVLASVPTQGGEVATVSLPTGFFATDVWPDGSKFIGTDARTRGKEGLAVASATGKSLQWLLQLPVQTSQGRWFAMGTWAPNGHKVAFCYGHDLFEARSDGGEMRRLASLNDWPAWPRWSPDGRVLRFSLFDRKAESTSIWQINADGTHLHALTFPGSAFSVTCCGNWMPNGKYFVFQAKQDGHYDIWALRERSSWPRRSGPRLVRLTSGPLNYFSPLPSRNGKEIFVFGGESRGELMRFDLKTHTFADFLGGISAVEVSFSRDGKWVAYVTYPDYTLWVARADSSDAMQLTFPPLEAREPHWSPNGEQIAFQGISDGPRYKIYLISREGGEPQQVIPGDGEESVATWWPDDQSLIYDEPLFRHDVSQMFIHRFDLRTRKSTVIPRTAGTWTARLPPDGRSIATLDATPTANPQHLYILDSVTGRRKLVVNVPGLSEPTWSQDGRYVYFAEISVRLPALYRVRVRDGELERLASLSKFPVAGVWTGVAPDGSPLLLRNTSTQELYALRVRLP